MRLRITSFNPEEKEYVLPSSINYRKADVRILKLCIIFALIAIVYCGPYKLSLPMHVSSGSVQSVTKVVSKPRRNTSRRVMEGLNIVIDNRRHYLDIDYIYNDGFGTSTKDVWTTEIALTRKENQPAAIYYLDYLPIGRDASAFVVGLEIDGKNWIDTQRSMEQFQGEAKLQTAVWSLGLLFLIIVHHLRKNYTIFLEKN